MRCFKLIIVSLGIMFAGPSLAQTPNYNWTGFYAGGNFGYGFGQPTAPAIGFSDPYGIGIGNFLELGGFNIASYPNKGVLGGIQAGYNYQISSWVLGAEADWSATDISGSYSALSTVDPNAVTGISVTNTNTSLDWLATLRARVGVASDKWLFYGTGGLALGRVTSGFDSYITDRSTGFTFSYNGANSTTNVGWTAGVGTEYALGRFSVKLEYLYYDVGPNRVTSPTIDKTYAGTSFLTLDQRTAGHIVRVGLNYHF
jgi:outer membrane immunogenic protein